jgi:hypothetical protein
MTAKEQVLDRAITDIQNQIMNAWKSVMKYEGQMRNLSVYEENDDMLSALISNEKSRIETLTAILDRLTPPAPDHKEIENARAILKDAGYYVDNLWHINDVKGHRDFTDDKAYEVLDKVLQGEYIMEAINESIQITIQQ